MIQPTEILRISLRALRVNKMRSALTILGMVIGVAAVIAMFAIGTGANRQISAQIAGIGSNLLLVLPGSATSGGRQMGFGSQPSLTLKDAEALRRECPSVAAVAPLVSGTAQLVRGNANWSTSVQGTTSDFLTVRDWRLESGRPFSESEIKSAGKVCILGRTVAKELFGEEDPLGQAMRVNKVPVRVIGVLVAKGGSAGGQDQDDTVLVPVTTAQKRLFPSRFRDKVRAFMVKARSAEEMDAAEAQIDAVLTQRHRIRTPEDKDFDVRNLSEMLEAAKESTRTMALLLAAIASVSLLVGGIGIMNIMLVSVTERTREIGIRMAIGAGGADILLQFLAEALILSLVGGAAGIALGIGGSWGLAGLMGWPTEISSRAILLSTGFSGAVGIFFGFYPAWKASRLRPIEALRYE
jgi:putative ABC transport system permease protein